MVSLETEWEVSGGENFEKYYRSPDTIICTPRIRCEEYLNCFGDNFFWKNINQRLVMGQSVESMVK